MAMRQCTLVGVTTFLLTAGAQAVPVVVGPGDPNWSIFRTDASGLNGTPTSATGQFVTGPGTPPAGTGSFNYSVPDGSGSVQLRTTLFAGTMLSSITNLGYSTYATQLDAGLQQLPFLTLYLDRDTTNATLEFDRLTFEPVYSTISAANGGTHADVALNTWQTWDVLTGYIYSDSNATIRLFSSYLTANPNAGLIQDPVQGGTMRLASGLFPGESFNTNVDNFVFNNTEFDFELVPELNPGAATLPLAFACLGLLVLGSRRTSGARTA